MGDLRQLEVAAPESFNHTRFRSRDARRDTAIGMRHWRASPLPPDPPMKTRYAEIPAYRTKDGSEIRELLHPAQHGNARQSLAEATIPPGTRTLLHRHERSEELYHVTHGEGLMTLGGESFPIGPGDTVAILPGTPHCVTNAGSEPLRILCCCSPAYAHDDTTLLDA